MRLLAGEEVKAAEHFFQVAAEEAELATCKRAQCGSVIVRDGEIIGRGYNSPPKDLESERRCANEKSGYDPKVTDKTCCMHAEVRAIMGALRKHPEKLFGSTLYFIRLDAEGNISRAGEPYCTICSKMALDAGVAEFVLWQERGIASYSTEEYNTRSYSYRSDN